MQKSKLLFVITCFHRNNGALCHTLDISGLCLFYETNLKKSMKEKHHVNEA